MKSNQNKSTLVQYKVKKAIEILTENVESIRDVQSWVDEAGVSRRWLCRAMKKVYRKPPKEVLREVKFEKVVWLICNEGLEAGCYSVAVDAGFKSASGLSKFLSAYHDINFTELKIEIITGEKHLNFIWLNKMPK